MEKLKIHYFGSVKDLNVGILPVYWLDAETKTR